MPVEKGTVSVIIPAYNRGAFLERAVTSCFTQTHQEVEVLVVDDGSTDNTREIAERLQSVWGRERLLYFYQENAGVSAARNAGLDRAKGAYIQFLDSDDALAPDKFSRQIEMLQKSGHCAAFCDFNFVDASGAVLREVVLGGVLREMLSHLSFVSISCCLIKAQALSSGFRFNTGMKRYEDADFLFRYLIRINAWDYSPGCLFLYTQHEGERLNRFFGSDKPVGEYLLFFDSIYADWKIHHKEFPSANHWMIREAAQKVANRLYAGGAYFEAVRTSFAALQPPFSLKRVKVAGNVFIRALVRYFLAFVPKTVKGRISREKPQ